MSIISSPRPSRAIAPYIVEKYAQTYWTTGSHDEACKATGRKSRMTMHRIRPVLQALSEQALEDVKGRRGRIVAELESLAYSHITDYLDISPSGVSFKEIPPEFAAAVESVKQTKNGIEIKLYDKLRALDTLAKITGLAVDHVDITSGGKAIQPIQMTFEVLPTPKRLLDTTMEVTDGKSNAGDTVDVAHTDRLAGADPGKDVAGGI